MSFDITSYVLGHEAGQGNVIITGAIDCTDDGDGNITITEEETSDE